MVTVRQIERHWNQKAYDRLLQVLVSVRPEGLYRPEPQAATATLAAAMAVIRLDELTQTHVPLYGKLVRAILAAQEPDGGWGDAAVTALCVRALQCSRGEGLAITRGLRYLADLQKMDGAWPNVPLRRMPADAHSSAFILAQLGDNADFRQAVRLPDAVAWLRDHAHELDEPTGQLWDCARLRCRYRAPALPGNCHDGPTKMTGQVSDPAMPGGRMDLAACGVADQVSRDTVVEARGHN